VYSGDDDAICATAGAQLWVWGMGMPAEAWHPWYSHGQVCLSLSVSGGVSLSVPCVSTPLTLSVSPYVSEFVCRCVCRCVSISACLALCIRQRKTCTYTCTHQNLNAHAIVHALVTHAYNQISLVSRWQVTRCSSLACVLAQCMVLVIWCHRRAPSKHSTCSKSSWTKNPGEHVVTHTCWGVSFFELRVRSARCVRSLTPTPTPKCRVREREGGRERESIELAYLLDRLAL